MKLAITMQLSCETDVDPEDFRDALVESGAIKPAKEGQDEETITCSHLQTYLEELFDNDLAEGLEQFGDLTASVVTIKDISPPTTPKTTASKR